MSQKWAVFLIDLFTNPAFVKNVDSSTLCTCYLAIFSSLAEYTDKLFVFHKNGSLHWFSIFALSIIKVWHLLFCCIDVLLQFRR